MPSTRFHLLVAALRLARVRDWQFDPQRFTGPKAAARSATNPRPSKKLSKSLTLRQSTVQGWPVYEVTRRDGPVTGELIYLHGGAFAAPIQAGHWGVIAHLVRRTGRRVTVPLYPRLPHAIARDVLAPLQDLLREAVTRAGTAGPVAVAGDSAGGGLALRLVQSVPARTRPRDLLLLSPWLDLALSDPDVARIAPSDPLLRPDHLRELGRAWAGGNDPADPSMSPLFGPLAHLGRVTVWTGSRDVLHPDARRLHRRIADNDDTGTSLVLHDVLGMVHDWGLMPIPEARILIDEVVAVLTADAPSGRIA